MKLTIIANTRKRAPLAIACAIAAGCERHGDRAEILDKRLTARGLEAAKIRKSDAVCCWGWREAKKHRELGRNVLVMERAYLANRFVWVSLGWNGLNGRAFFPRPDDGGARWRKHFAQLMCPWASVSDGYALLLGQVPSDKAVNMIKFKKWAAYIAADLNRLGYDVRFRPHPKAKPSPPPAPVVGGTLKKAFADASFAVTWNSNSGVDAVLAGVPTITMDRGAMAWDVTSHDLTSPMITPDRETWARYMAYTQWLPLEIENGEAWEHLRTLMSHF